MIHLKLANKQQFKEPTLEESLKKFGSAFKELLNDYSIDDFVLIDYIEMQDDIIRGFKKLTTLWKYKHDNNEYWWEFQYDKPVKTLCLSAFLSYNYRMTMVNGPYHINLAINLFQRYSKQLSLNNQNFQFNINPLTGSIKIISKVLIKEDQYKFQVIKPEYMYSIYCQLNSMLEMLKKLALLQKYFDGQLQSCPVERFFNEKQQMGNGITANIFLKAIIRSCNQVDPNCQQSLESFGSPQSVAQYTKQKLEFPLEMAQICHLLKGENQMNKQQVEDITITEIISKIYEASLMSQGIQSGVLVKKIKILNQPHEINWKLFAYGGFGKIQKATIKYQLSDFSHRDVETAYGEIVRKSDTSDSNKIGHEIRILNLIKNDEHANIMPYFISEQSAHRNYIFSKYEPNLSLDKYIRVNKKTVSLQTISRLMQHTLKGLMFLKQKNIAHLDMKPNNIIVSRDLSAKLSDFGQAFHFNEDARNHQHGFTIPYVSPEVFYEQPYLNSKVDVYSFGATMYKVIFGEHLWGQILDRDKFREDLVQNLTPPLKMAPEGLFKYGVKEIIGVLANLSIKCVNRDQSDRPSLFYLSVVLSLCRFYIYALIDGSYRPTN